jgi:hypothetical protein
MLSYADNRDVYLSCPAAERHGGGGKHGCLKITAKVVKFGGEEAEGQDIVWRDVRQHDAALDGGIDREVDLGVKRRARASRQA